jgi:hypothetical protein
MSSDVIEGRLIHLANPNFSPSMTTLDVLSEPIFQPIRDPDNPSYALFPKSHDDPKNPLRQPNIGVMKATRMTIKCNSNGWNVLRTNLSLLKIGWTRMKPYG